MKSELTLMVNGETYTVWIEDHETLLKVLREDLALTGTKEGCNEGECGACTVLVNGQPMNSCLILAREMEGASIETIEGEARNEVLSQLQQAFIEAGAIQCGFCTPGMIMSARALLERNPHPTEEEIKEALSGNLCRCTGYYGIIEAVQLAARKGGESHGRKYDR